MFTVFPSIGHPEKYGYSFNSDPEYTASAFLASTFRMFQTYGDGLCQHSSCWPVTEEYAIDYLFSLAAELEKNGDLCEEVRREFNRTPSVEDMKFAAGLVWNPEKDTGFGKTRYYSVELHKVTRNYEKSHDTRYTELYSNNDGTPKAIYEIVVPGHARGLARWTYAKTVREWAQDNLKNGWMEMPAVFLEWFQNDRDQYQRSREFQSAFEVCAYLTECEWKRREAARRIEHYRGIALVRSLPGIVLPEDAADAEPVAAAS